MHTMEKDAALGCAALRCDGGRRRFSNLISVIADHAAATASAFIAIVAVCLLACLLACLAVA